MFACLRTGGTDKPSLSQLLSRAARGGKGATTAEVSIPDFRAKVSTSESISVTPKAESCSDTSIPVAAQEAAILFPVAADMTLESARSARSERGAKDTWSDADQKSLTRGASNRAGMYASKTASVGSTEKKSDAVKSAQYDVGTPVKVSPRLRSGHNTPRTRAVLPEGNLKQLENDYQDLQAQFHALRTSPHWKQGFALPTTSPVTKTPKHSPSPRSARSVRLEADGTGFNKREASAMNSIAKPEAQGNSKALQSKMAHGRRMGTPLKTDASTAGTPTSAKGTKRSPQAAFANREDVLSSQASTVDSSLASLRLPMPPVNASTGSFAGLYRHTSPGSLLPGAPANGTPRSSQLWTTTSAIPSMIPTLATTGAPDHSPCPSPSAAYPGFALNPRLPVGGLQAMPVVSTPSHAVMTAPSFNQLQRGSAPALDGGVPGNELMTIHPESKPGLVTSDLFIQHNENKRTANMPQQPACIVAEAVPGKQKGGFKGMLGKMKAMLKGKS